jgi:hypothetical protein
MQTLFGGPWKPVERGPFPFAELLFLLALFAVLMYWFSVHGSPPVAAACVGAGLGLLFVITFVRGWQSGNGPWNARAARFSAGPFPWATFRKENVGWATLMAFFVIARLPVSMIEILAGSLLAWDALWVGRWLRANSRERPRNPDGQARG